MFHAVLVNYFVRPGTTLDLDIGGEKGKKIK